VGEENKNGGIGEMGVFKRMKRIVTADLHDAVDKMENPISLLKQYIREVEEQLEKGKQAIAQQYAVEQKYSLLIASEQEMAGKRKRQAELAVSKGEEDIARLALQEKIVSERKLSVYIQQYEIIQEKTNELAGQLESLHRQYEELKLKKNELAARYQAATAIKNIQESTVSFKADQAISGFARMEEKVLEQESYIKAGHLLSANAYKPSVSPHLADEVELELENLKTKE
jgi:phage shock protein A